MTIFSHVKDHIIGVNRILSLSSPNMFLQGGGWDNIFGKTNPRGANFLHTSFIRLDSLSLSSCVLYQFLEWRSDKISNQKELISSILDYLNFTQVELMLLLLIILLSIKFVQFVSVLLKRFYICGSFDTLYFVIIHIPKYIFRPRSLNKSSHTTSGVLFLFKDRKIQYSHFLSYD